MVYFTEDIKCSQNLHYLKLYSAYTVTYLYGLVVKGCSSQENLERIFVYQKKYPPNKVVQKRYDHISNSAKQILKIWENEQ